MYKFILEHCSDRVEKIHILTHREHNICIIRKSTGRVVIVGSLFHFSSSCTPRLWDRGEIEDSMPSLFVVTPPIRYFAPTQQWEGKRKIYWKARPRPQLFNGLCNSKKPLTVLGLSDLSLIKWGLSTRTWSLWPWKGRWEVPLGSLGPRSPPLGAPKDYETIVTYPHAG